MASGVAQGSPTSGRGKITDACALQKLAPGNELMNSFHTAVRFLVSRWFAVIAENTRARVGIRL